MYLFSFKQSLSKCVLKKTFYLVLVISIYFVYSNYISYIKITYFKQDISFDISGQNKPPCLNSNQELNISMWTFLTEHDGYADSAVKLIRSIKRNTCFTLNNFFMMEVREKPLPTHIKKKLEDAGWRVKSLNRIPPRDEAGTYPRFRDQFTKLELWNIDEYEANIYFDSDTFVIGNIDELLNIYQSFKTDRHKIGVTRDIRAGLWQRTFNMGVFVVKPNKTEYKYLLDLKNDDDFKFETTMSEQGFLNEVYKNQWYEIGFENNANLAFLTEKPDYWWARSNEINIIHFTLQKPWSCGGVFKKVCELWVNF